MDFFSPKQIADRIEEVLDHSTRMAEIRVKARQTVLERYALSNLLVKHLELINQVANRTLTPTIGTEKKPSLTLSTL